MKRVWVVLIEYEDGQEIEVYRYAKDADRRVREVRRENKDDINLIVTAAPHFVR